MHHEPPPPEPRGLGRRLMWFVGLWIAGVAVLGVIGFLIRATLIGV
jgi:hypothetical protein